MLDAHSMERLIKLEREMKSLSDIVDRLLRAVDKLADTTIGLEARIEKLEKGSKKDELPQRDPNPGGGVET